MPETRNDIGYDYDNARLKLDLGDKFKFDLQLRPPYTAITGDSATGKTLLVNTILRYIEIKGLDGEDVNMRAFRFGASINDISGVNHCLIVIDKADKYMTEELRNYIHRDKSNHYLFISRVDLGLGMSPNYIGEFVTEDNRTIKIHFEYNEVGWS